MSFRWTESETSPICSPIVNRIHFSSWAKKMTPTDPSTVNFKQLMKPKFFLYNWDGILRLPRLYYTSPATRRWSMLLMFLCYLCNSSTHQCSALCAELQTSIEVSAGRPGPTSSGSSGFCFARRPPIWKKKKKPLPYDLPSTKPRIHSYEKYIVR